MAFWFLAIPELLLPGYAWILISGLSRRFDSLEKLSLSFILSVCFTALFTATLSLLTPDYLFYSSAVSLALSVGAIALYLLLRRSSLVRPNFRLKVGFESLPLLLAIVVYAVILVLLFWSAPYYPSADSFDPINHAQVVAAIISGSGRYVVLQGGIPRAGMHFVAAILAGLCAIDPLPSLRILLSILILTSLLLVYSSARVLFGNGKIAGATVLVAAFVFPVDAIHFVQVGTYANVAGDVVILALLLLFFSYVRQPSSTVGVTLAFLGIAGAFMHSSFLLFLAALWVFVPVIHLISRAKLRNYVCGALYSTLGLLGLAPILTTVFARNVEQIYMSYVVLANPNLLNADSFFLTLSVFTYNFSKLLGPIGMAAVGLAIVIILKQRRHALEPTFAAFWFTFLVLVSFFSSQDWRFILFSFLPATFLVGAMIGWAPNLVAQSRELGERVKRNTARVIVPLALCVLVISGGFSTSGLFGVISRAYDPSERSRQQAVFDSMVWLRQNGCSNVSVASVGLDMDYRYLPALAGIQYVGDFDKPAGELQQDSQVLGFHCLAVAIASQNFQSFQLDSVFHEEYRNDVVALFTIS